MDKEEFIMRMKLLTKGQKIKFIAATAPEQLGFIILKVFEGSEEDAYEYEGKIAKRINEIDSPIVPFVHYE